MERYQFSKQEQEILEALHQPFAIYQFLNKRVVTLVLSDGFCKMFGYSSRAQAYHDMDHDMYKSTYPDDIARIANDAYRFASEDIPYDVIYRAKKKNQSSYSIIHATGSHFVTREGVRLAQVWYVDEGPFVEEDGFYPVLLNDVLSKALCEDNSTQSTRFDFLTGLPSMTYFFELADEGKKVIEKEGDKAAMLFIDLSGMKYFNSKYGFSEGDKLLQSFARILNRMFNNECCCHVGGDHFAAFTREEGLEEKLNSLFEECRGLNNGNSLPVRVGIFSASLEDVPACIACDRAKLACDALRNTFESDFNYYNTSQLEEAERRQYVRTNLDRAIEENWIKVYYQPIVRAVNGCVCDEEALARWIDPDRGFMSPAYFIPYLEDSGQIYKLDLYMLDRVLEKMNYQKINGFNIVPHSINLSRSDFDACDIVEEVRRRVDDSGLPRSFITVEITESAIGSDFDFMKQQIARFRQLGFPVWMDDFGSGYSSLDVLQSISFDLIKFDMIFMKKLNDGQSGKIVLTELMRMATSLGVDTVCEGVETIEQMRFLQEIGCSKLQGYYYSKPIPLENILERYEKGIQIGYENPRESEYYETMGRINLYDMSAIASEDENDFHNVFNTLPMGVMELKDNSAKVVRSNKSYRRFMRRFFGVDLSKVGGDVCFPTEGLGSSFMKLARECCVTGGRVFFDEQMPDGSIIHFAIRRLSQNPVTGKTSVAVAVLSIRNADEGTSYANIARALAADYYNIYYVDLENDHFIEYSSPVGEEELAVERHGEHFFESAKQDISRRIYEDDVEFMMSTFSRENVLKEVDEQGAFTATYRLVDTGTPVYVNLKAIKMPQDPNHLIIGISVVDSQMKQQEMIETIQREKTAYARIMALTGGYLSLYTVDPATGKYYEYSASKDYETFGFAKTGTDFFENGISDGKRVVFEDDLPEYLRSFRQENVMREIRKSGSYKLQYRLVIKGIPMPVLMKIVSVKESDGEKLIVGVRLWRDRQ